MNEDRCCVGNWASDGRNGSWQGLIDREPAWAVVADGMGGHEAGELASESAVRTIMDLAGTVASDDDVVRMLELADERIYKEMYNGRGRPAMGSTVVGVVLLGHTAIMFNVGDSRLYLVDGAGLSLESVDDTLAHTLPNRPVRSHALTQSLGGSYSRKPFVPHIKRRAISGRRGLLLCSDGLTDMLSDKEISDILSSEPAHPAQALVSAALDAGGADNVTVVVIGIAS